ncbi:hypothetical protein L2E82_27623 [Cichorium intybus]|uniref:Uncharacterized protein n=1 Tax=Cichorium intybus TaxID=13427 RepID=A0ACB9CTS8_CICIN|nr:hypothetical protein L2E82_27623 [Cichorium intybus]
MRRRQASDDDEEEDYASGRERIIGSRVSDAEESDLEDELLEEVEEEEEEEEFGEHWSGSDAQRLVAQVQRKDLVDGVIDRRSKKEEEQTDGDGFYVQDNVDQIGDNVSESGEGQCQEEKKANEPFSVPTAGAFYMHDDRFRDGGEGRHRRTLDGRNLWESRDDLKWGHDKFEERSMQERHYKEGRRMSKGRHQAHGRNKGQDRKYPRPKSQDNNNQNSAPKFARGKGPRRYQPVTKNSIDTCANKRGPLNSLEKVSHENTSAKSSTSESAQFPSSKNGLASSLSVASPPFYPSGSSIKEISSTQKKDGQSGQKKETYSNNIPGKNASYKGRGQTSTIFPVMQFAGQHPGGLGVPALGMAFPGYVGQPNGMGNSEMTWLPVLAGTAGSLGAYHAWTAGQMSSLPPASSKDSSINEHGNKVKSGKAYCWFLKFDL